MCIRLQLESITVGMRVPVTSHPKPIKVARSSKGGGVRAPATPTGGSLDLGALNDLLGFHFRRIQNHISRAFQNDPRHGDLKSGLFSIMALISANPGVSQTRLALEAGIDKTALVALLDYLEDQSWAVRARAKDDRRKHSLYITPQGLAVLQTLTVAAHEIEASAREALTPDELTQLLAILDKLYAHHFREEEL